MTAKTTKPVFFRGQEVTLKFPLLALERMKNVGVDLMQFGDEQDMDISMLGKIVWAGLSCEYNDASLEEVLLAFDITDLTALSELVNAAFSKMGK